MAQGFEIEATVRERVGKGSARKLRREGMIPAVIYGDKQPPLAIAMPYKTAFERLHAGGFLTNIWTITVDGAPHRVLARDYQLEPVRDFLTHVDFLRVTGTTRVEVEVPVRFLNEDKAPGLVKGGVLNIVRHAVELECPADSIPDALEIDLTGHEIGDTIHASAITLPEGITFTITDRDFTVATIAPPLVEVEEEQAEEPGEVPVAGEEEEGEGEGEGGGEGGKER